MRIFIFVLWLLLLISVPLYAEEPTPGVKLDRFGITVEDNEDHSKPAGVQDDSAKPTEPAEKKDLDEKVETEHKEEEKKESESGPKPAPKETKPSRPEGSKAATGTSGESPQQPLAKQPEDRPYIIHQAPLPKHATPVTPKGPPVKYKDEEQQERCEKLLEQIEDSYLKARYYSVEGDACSTTKFAEKFLESVGKCTSDCPKDTLASNGYDAEFIRNIRRLKELGRIRCLQGGK